MNTCEKVLCATAAAAAIALLGVPAAAQSAPAYAAPGDEVVRGVVASIDGKYAISVRDDRGFVDRVALHDGTIINPTGLRLAPGERVRIAGHADGDRFVANEIDTPYGRAYGYGPYARGGFAFGFRGRF